MLPEAEEYIVVEGARDGRYKAGPTRCQVMVGKAPPGDLAAHVLDRTGAGDDRLRQGPAYGEDAAAIEVGDSTLVVSSDPISMASERIGTLGVPVACNDVAASGADPSWVTVVVFVPEDDPALLDRITTQVHEAALAMGVAVAGGHTEYDPDRARPLLSLTAWGLAEQFLPTGGARPGDRVLLTGGAGIEGTAILASDFRERLLAADVDEGTIGRAETFFSEISVLPEAQVVRELATALHDPTEGGVHAGLFELAAASDTVVDIERDRVPIREATRRLCRAVGVDPLRIFGSGALLATVPATDADAAREALEDEGVEAAEVGRVRTGEAPALVVDGERFESPGRDELYPLWG